MRVLLTGSTGYIGHQLAIKLANSNYKVNALVRDLNSKNIPIHKNITPVKGNVCNYESIKNAIQKCEVVFHAAAFTDLKCNNIDNFYKTNVIGTENVLRASLECNIKKVVHTSTLSVFGPALNGVPITEKQPRIVTYSNDYELTKTMSEEKVLEYVKKGLPCSILNVSRVYGPGLNSFSNGVNKIVSKIMKDRVLYVPDRLNIEANYVYIDDVLNAHLLALEKGQPGEKYIIGGENIDYTGLFKKIMAISNSQISVLKINYDLVKKGLAIMTFFNRLIGIVPLLTPKVLDSLFTNRSASSKKAQESLDYDYTPLEIGLQHTINYLT